MASGNTRATLASGNFLGIMNCLMQLRKVRGLGDGSSRQRRPRQARQVCCG